MVTTTVTVRFSDTDAMGHCNNRNYFSFMEEAREAFFTKLNPGISAARSFEMFPFILADIQCSFKAPAYCGDVIEVSVVVDGFGTKSFNMSYELKNKSTGTLVATGKSVQVMFDYKTQKSIPVPDEFKKSVQAL